MPIKLLKTATLIVSIILIIAGCSGRVDKKIAAPQPEKLLYTWGTTSGETITIWGDKDDLYRPYMTRAFERYQQQTGNTIVVRPLSKKDLDELVPQAFASATQEKPDILLSYGGTNVENLKPDENFYDFTKAPWINDLTDTALNQAIFNGKVIGFPHGEASVSGTLYNKEIFKELGLEIPKTQAEFLQVCETLLQNGITPMYMPYAEITMLLYQFPMDSIVKDRKLLNGLNAGSLSYADLPEMKKIVQWYKTMAEKGYFGANYQQNDWKGMSSAMEGGQYAMMLCWDTWLYTSYSGNPDKIGLMPAFMGTPEKGCFEGANIILCLANKNSPRLKTSLDLITFMAEPSNYNIHYAGLYTAPVFNRQSGSITTPQYMAAERLIDKLFYDSTAWSRVRGFSQIDAVYIQEYMQNQRSLDDCLSAMNAARIKRAGIQAVSNLGARDRR